MRRFALLGGVLLALDLLQQGTRVGGCLRPGKTRAHQGDGATKQQMPPQCPPRIRWTIADNQIGDHKYSL